MRASLINKHMVLKHLTPDFAISGCVASVEDHGYIVDLGMHGVTAFLPLQAVPKSTVLLAGIKFR